MTNILDKIEDIFQRPDIVLNSVFASSKEYSLPNRKDLKLFEISPNANSQVDLISKNLIVDRTKAKGTNYVLLDLRNKFTKRFTINLHGSDNIIVIGNQVPCCGQLFCKGNNGVFIVTGEIDQQCNLTVRLLGNNSTFFFGKHSTANGLICIMNGSDTNVIIGDDCMFARDVWLRNSDMHSIFDVDSGEWLNPAGDIIIGSHVWLGQDSFILKNTEIGFGSIIGAKSLVNKKIAKCSLAAGVPAKTIKTNVSWDRRIEPTAENMEYVRSFKEQLI